MILFFRNEVVGCRKIVLCCEIMLFSFSSKSLLMLFCLWSYFHAQMSWRCRRIRGCFAGMIEGTVVELQDLKFLKGKLGEPIAHEEIELFFKTGRIHNVELLSPQHTRRKGQAADRFSVSVQSMLGQYIVCTYITHTHTYLHTLHA